MIAIADSGSTKTSWCFINQETLQETNLRTIGLNPIFVKEEDVRRCVEKEIDPIVDIRDVDTIYFYGAACAADFRKLKLMSMLYDVFPSARISVESDLLGAAISFYGEDKEAKDGFVGILGTGSSSCFYQGGKIKEMQMSLGYILGDEGSGAYIGKMLLRDYLYGEMPQKEAEQLERFMQASKAEIIQRLYSEEFPNRYLASVIEFIKEDSEYISQKLKVAFGEYFKKQLLKYKDIKNYPISLVGSVSYIFRKEISEVAALFGLQIEKFEQSPMQGLIENIKKQIKKI